MSCCGTAAFMGHPEGCSRWNSTVVCGVRFGLGAEVERAVALEFGISRETGA